MRNVLIVYGKIDENSSRGTRQKHIISYLSRSCKVYLYEVDNALPSSKPAQILLELRRKLTYPHQSYSHRYKATKKEVLSLVDNKNIDAVIILTKPFFLMKLIVPIKHAHPNVMVCCDMTDPFSSNVELLHTNSLHKRMIQSFEEKYMSEADYIVVLNKEILKYYQDICKNIVVIEQGIDDSLIDAIRNSEGGFAKDNTTSLVYAGNFYKKIRDPHELYRAIDAIKQEVKLTIYTHVEKRECLPHSTEQIENLPSVDKDELFKVYANSNIIVFIDNFFGIQVPGKTLEVLATNKPVLFIYNNKYSPTLNYVKSQKGIFLVENDYVAISETIERILDQEVSTWNRDVKKYYWENILNMYITIIDSWNM